MAASKKEAASVDADAVDIVGVDAVDGADAEAEAVPARSDKVFTIQNNHECSRHLVKTWGRFVGPV